MYGSNSTATGNLIRNSGSENGAIFIQCDGNTDSSAIGNDIQASGSGCVVDVAIDEDSIVVNDNCFEHLSGSCGLRFDGMPCSGALNAQNNFWDSANGPGDVLNVVAGGGGNVDTDPFLESCPLSLSQAMCCVPFSVCTPLTDGFFEPAPDVP